MSIRRAWEAIFITFEIGDGGGMQFWHYVFTVCPLKVVLLEISLL
jgi:hypothetical protein